MFLVVLKRAFIMIESSSRQKVTEIDIFFENPGEPEPSRAVGQSLIREPSPDRLIDWCHWLTQKDRPRVFQRAVPCVQSSLPNQDYRFSGCN